MWSTIGLATARRARVVGGAALSVDKLMRLASRVPSQLRSPIAVASPDLAAAGSLVQRRCFAAAKAGAKTTKKATKKPATKPKKKAAAKKPATKKRVALTPEQKKRRDVLKDRKTALLAAEPAKLPATPRAVFTSEYIKSARKSEEPWTRALAGETFSGAAQAFKDISAYDLERVTKAASQNKLANDAAFKSWLESHTPAEIHAANLARKRLSKTVLKDARLPTRPVNSYALFIKSRYVTGTGVSVTEQSKQLAAEWKSLSDAERQPFIESSRVDHERYEKEVKDVLGRQVRHQSPKSP